MTEDIKISGVMFYYYFVCKRKLWYFSQGIAMEQNNEDVAIGKLIDAKSYSREKKQILIDDTINIDFIDGNKVIHEIKKSKTVNEAGIWQLKYYIYYLKIRGVEGITGLVDYPTLRKREKVTLTFEDTDEIERLLLNLKNIIEKPLPPGVINEKFCKKCAYYELCYI